MVKSNIKIRFFDCDPAGILFFGNVYKLAHAQFEDMIKSFNLNFNYFDSNEFAFPIIHSGAEYFKPMKAGDYISIEIGVTNIGTSSFSLDYIFKNESDIILTKVNTVHVAVSKFDFKKTDLPELLRKKLEELA